MRTIFRHFQFENIATIFLDVVMEEMAAQSSLSNISDTKNSIEHSFDEFGTP